MIKKVIELIPILGSVLLFLGYWNLAFFYKQFNINIYNFITTGEILTSFLPVITSTFVTSIIIACVVLVFLGLGAIAIKLRRDPSYFTKDRLLDFTDLTGDIVADFSSLFSKTEYASKTFFKASSTFFGNFIFLTLRLCFPAACIYMLRGSYLLFATKNPFIYYYFTFIVVVILFVVIALVVVISANLSLHLKNGFSLIRNRLFHWLFLIAAFIFVNSLYNYKEAVKLQQGKPDFFVEFVSEKEKIQSGNVLVYLGQTQQYLFIFDINTKRQFIYKTSDIKGLQIMSNFK